MKMMRGFRETRHVPETDGACDEREKAARPVAYLTGMYPKVSHTFILREVAALREMGVHVLPCSVRRPSSQELRGREVEAEHDLTFYLYEAALNPLRLAANHAHLLVTSPRRWIESLFLAWRTCPPGLTAGLWQSFYFAEAGVLAEYLRQKKVAHLHNHLGDSSGTVALLAATMAGIPFSYTAHGPDLFFEPRYWRIDVKTAQAKFVACISHFCRSQMMLFSEQKYWEKLKIIRCGIEPQRYGNKPRNIFKKRILFVGRMVSVKGTQLLLSAFARIHSRHPTSTLVLVGDGPDRPMLKERAEVLGLSGSIEFKGYCSQEEVASLMGEADLVVLPSFAEGLPVVLMEALASGIPVVATSVAGVTELVRQGETGIVVPPGDIDALERALDTLLEDPELCNSLGDAGRKVVRKYHDVNQEAKKLKNLFESTEAPNLE